MKKLICVAALAVLSAACEDPFMAEGTRTYKSVATGGDHTCAVATDGYAYCWGRGLDGELGIGVKENRSTPSKVVGNINFDQITVGDYHSCGLSVSGEAFCWGWTPFYQRGNPTDTRDSEPVPVTTERRFTSLTAGAHHTCALTLDSLAYCWGYNRYGQVGSLGTETGFQPRAVEGGIKFKQISAGGFHTCGLSAAGAIYCWGSNEFGQLGTGGTQLVSLTPAAAQSTVLFQAVDAGESHTCAVSVASAAYCWGSNEFGELGNGGAFRPGLPAVNIPAAVSDQLPRAVTRISAGAKHTCAGSARGDTWCWGRGTYAQLGNGSTDTHYQPQRVHMQPITQHVDDLLKIDALAAGGATHMCALANGGVFCWGTGHAGQLGTRGSALAFNPQRIIDE